MAMLEKAELTESSAETDSAQRGGVWGRRRAVGALWRLGTRVALFAASIAILFVLWIIGSRHFSPLILPGPTSVWHGFLGDWRSGFVTSDISATVEHLFIAYGITVLLGVPIGILIGRYWVVEDLTRAYLIFIQTIPTIVLIVLVLIFLGSTPIGSRFRSSPSRAMARCSSTGPRWYTAPRAMCPVGGHSSSARSMAPSTATPRR